MTTIERRPGSRPRGTLAAVLGGALAVVLVVGAVVALTAGPDGDDAGYAALGGVPSGAEARWSVEVGYVVDAAALSGEAEVTVLQTFDDPTEPEIVADNLVAVDEDGEQVWDVEDAAIMDGARLSDGLLVSTGTTDDLDDDAGVARYDAAGDEVWSVDGVARATSLEGAVVADAADGSGTVLLDPVSGEPVAEHPGRLAGAAGDRVVVVEGGDVVGLDLAGAEQWRTTVDDRFGNVPEAPDLEDLEELGETLEDIDPATPEGRRELRDLREDNRALRDYLRDDTPYFGAGPGTELAAAVSGDLVVVATSNPDPTDGEDVEEGDLGYGLAETAQVALDAGDGTVRRAPTEPEDGSYDELPPVEAGPPGTVVVDGTLLGGDGRPVDPRQDDPVSADGLVGGVVSDSLGTLLDADLREVPVPGEVVATSDDGPYTIDGTDLVLTAWDDPDDVLARVEVAAGEDMTDDVVPVDGGLLVATEGPDVVTLYR